MKRASDLWDQIIVPENFRIAFHSAAKGKWGRCAVQSFSRGLNTNILKLCDLLRSGRYKPQPLNHFTIHDPKKRVIHAPHFEDRIVHHAIMNICGPVFEGHQIFDSYACRHGKGQYKALERAESYAANNKFYLQFDIRYYFDSISHSKLFSLLQRKFKDAKLLELFHRIIVSYQNGPGQGIPMGSLTSQYFANHFISPLDRFIKERLQCRCYVRYMDDCVIWSNSSQHLIEVLDNVTSFLTNELALTLKPVPVINSTNHGMNFLGYRVFPEYLGLNRRSKSRIRKKVAAYKEFYDSGTWSEQTMHDHILPMLAFMVRARSEQFRKGIFGCQSKGKDRVNRGGSWNNNARNARSANRNRR